MVLGSALSDALSEPRSESAWEDRPVGRTVRVMRVMTWNVENWFMPGGTAGVTDSGLWNQKLANLAEMITAHRPDVIGLQEIGDPAALAALKIRLGTRYPHVLVATHFDAMHPIRVGVLVRRGLHTTSVGELIDFPAGALSDVPQASGPLIAAAPWPQKAPQPKRPPLCETSKVQCNWSMAKRFGSRSAPKTDFKKATS